MSSLSPATATTRIARHLQNITHQHFFKTYDDWLAITVNSFLRDDDAFFAILNRYGPRTAPMDTKDHPAEHFARALGTWMLAMQSEPADYLGRIYEEQALANNYSGQFFTPKPLVELMAAITMPNTLPDEATVSDPACGSGRMLIAGIKRNRLATFVGVDTDLTCVHMTALNCLVRNANTWIIHGNSLSLEAQGGYHVRRSPLGGEIFRLDQPTAERILKLPLRQAETSTALSPTLTTAPPAPTIAEPAADVRETLEQTSQQFTTDKKGQREFGF